MIDKSTVLVLGAGASCAYGLPLGWELRNRLLEMSVESLLTLPSGRQGVPIELIHQFNSAFRLSQWLSIDAFLAHRPEFIELGKHAIAAVLLPAERAERVLHSEPSDHWYRYLAHRMDTSWDRLTDNKVSFVTFNYDRSLELFLETTFINRYGKAENEVRERLKAFPLIHVYGQLGSLDPDSPSFVHYGDTSARAVKIAADGLRIIPEGRDESPEFEAARALLDAAERICFLGFGFDEMNVKRLGGPSINIRSKAGRGFGQLAAASAFGSTQAERQKYGRMISSAPDETAGRMHPGNCIETLRHTQILG
jgi:hypothetical protein